ncbi:MAG: hypothetical protein GF320_06395 [Armatimonadia bacterium]|nr:hypothetical protein [Armatimonadia bacterium]
MTTEARTIMRGMITGRKVCAVLALMILLAPASSQEAGAGPCVVITLAGDQSVVIELHEDDAPETVANFLRLVDDRFYDGLTFHRVEDWVVQTGCPEGDGSGGPPWTITREISGHPNVRGAVGMARVGDDPHSAGSQFYILKEDSTHLDGEYAVFGRVVEGLEAVDQVQVGDVVSSVRREGAETDPPRPDSPPPAESQPEEGPEPMPIDAQYLEGAPEYSIADLAHAPADSANPGLRLILAGGDEIIIELRADAAPETCAHFAGVVASGFLDGVYFHRSDEMCIQGGDGTTAGKAPWPETVDLEVSGLPFVPGSVGMARTQDPHSASSQFFICKTEATHLNDGYANFGHVLKGLDAALSMPERQLGAGDAPLNEDYRIVKAELVRFVP